MLVMNILTQCNSNKVDPANDQQAAAYGGDVKELMHSSEYANIDADTKQGGASTKKKNAACQ